MFVKIDNMIYNQKQIGSSLVNQLESRLETAEIVATPPNVTVANVTTITANFFTIDIQNEQLIKTPRTAGSSVIFVIQNESCNREVEIPVINNSAVMTFMSQVPGIFTFHINDASGVCIMEVLPQ